MSEVNILVWLYVVFVSQTGNRIITWQCLLPVWIITKWFSLMRTADLSTSKGKYLQLCIKQYYHKFMFLLWESVKDWLIVNLNVIKLTLLIDCWVGINFIEIAWLHLFANFRMLSTLWIWESNNCQYFSGYQSSSMFYFISYDCLCTQL